MLGVSVERSPQGFQDVDLVDTLRNKNQVLGRGGVLGLSAVLLHIGIALQSRAVRNKPSIIASMLRLLGEGGLWWHQYISGQRHTGSL